jgi:hypothetical protein
MLEDTSFRLYRLRGMALVCAMLGHVVPMLNPGVLVLHDFARERRGEGIRCGDDVKFLMKFISTVALSGVIYKLFPSPIHYACELTWRALSVGFICEKRLYSYQNSALISMSELCISIIVMLFNINSFINMLQGINSPIGVMSTTYGHLLPGVMPVAFESAICMFAVSTTLFALAYFSEQFLERKFFPSSVLRLEVQLEGIDVANLSNATIEKAYNAAQESIIASVNFDRMGGGRSFHPAEVG